MDDSTNRPIQDNSWSIVLDVSESEDFCWHVEFELGIHIEAWAGGWKYLIKESLKEFLLNGKALRYW